MEKQRAKCLKSSLTDNENDATSGSTSNDITITASKPNKYNQQLGEFEKI